MKIKSPKITKQREIMEKKENRYVGGSSKENYAEYVIKLRSLVFIAVIILSELTQSSLLFITLLLYSLDSILVQIL